MKNSQVEHLKNVMTDGTAFYRYSFEGSEVVKFMIRYALDNNDISYVKALLEELLKNAEKI